MAKTRAEQPVVTAEILAQKQREISVSEFFLKNRHLLGFDNPRKALLTSIKEAVDNSLDACEEANILPEVSVLVLQTGEDRFRIEVTDNGPGVVPAQIPRIFAKLLYGSKFHRLRMARGQQGIGISAAGMYGQLTTASATRILSKTGPGKKARLIEVQIDTSKNKPTILKDQETDWRPEFTPVNPEGKPMKSVAYNRGTCVAIEMEASYVRGRLSVDEYLRQCAIVNPHLTLHCRIELLRKTEEKQATQDSSAPAATAQAAAAESATTVALSTTFARSVNKVPVQPREIKPHPHGVELGALIQMLRDSTSRTVRSALVQDFSRVSSQTALAICRQAGLDPNSKPGRLAQQQSEALFKAIGAAKLMRPPTDCLTPIGEQQLISGLKKEIEAEFYTAVTRPPTVYRGNPFQIEVGLACAPATQAKTDDIGAEELIRLMRFANRVPLLSMAGACAINKAVCGVNWKNYGLSQPKGSLPLGPVVLAVHIASVWVPFTSESKEAIAHYPEIMSEISLGVQECGRQLSVFLSRRRRRVEALRKRDYIALYIPHLALGLKQVLGLTGKQEQQIVNNLNKALERTHLETA